MSFFKRLFSSEKDTENKQDNQNVNKIVKQARDYNKWTNDVFELSQKASELHKANRNQEAISILEKAIYELDSDIPYSYSLLIEIYEKDNNKDGLTKLLTKITKEINRSRNEINGSSVKFQRLSNEIQLILNMEKYAEEISEYLNKNNELNKTEVISKIQDLVDLDPSQANQIYKYCLENKYITREKIKGVYRHKGA
ncbi:hypothetical protein [Peribacillus sp. YIM B13482]|uniref:hypothetical protein n=1 Tax=Peribacillus sp. YIM B13482 TaxID=3366298 RepID=UPI00367221FC